MTLQPPRLDDLTWDAIMEATRRRIPAESGGRWTLHAPADPGVTVLELLAYLLEQRLYRLDQLPDSLVVAVLRLLGVPAPQPARAAATVLRLAAAPAVSTVVPAGTVLSRDPLEQITFTLDHDVAVLPLAPDVRLLAGGRDRGADLQTGRGVPVLSAAGAADEFRIELRPVAGSPPPPAGTHLSLLIELEAPAQCPPSWSPDAVADVAPPAALSWSWYRPGSPGELSDVDDLDDGTAGLRRSGIVRLRLPDQWCAGGDPPDGYGLRVHTPAATFSAPPVLIQLAPNAGAARNRQTRTVTDADLSDQLATWLRLPGQHLSLPDARGVLLEAVLRLRRAGELVEWHAAPDFTFGGPADRIFVLDRAEGALRFGDGLTGAVPVHDTPGGAGEPVAVVDYVRGGGAAGNGGRTGNWFLVGRPAVAPELTAANLVPAAGGREPETVAQARRRATEELTRVTRAVTAADFAELAGGTPGVAVGRSYVGIGEHPSYPGRRVPGAVTVLVLPRVARGAAQLDSAGYTGALQPDPGLLRQVRAHLEPARLVGTELFVCRPRYRRADLRVELAGRPAEPAGVRAALRLALRRYLDPLAGGEDGNGWPFGGPLRPSALLRVAQQAVADTAQATAVAVGLDGEPPAEDCADVALRPGELVALETVGVRVTGEVRP